MKPEFLSRQSTRSLFVKGLITATGSLSALHIYNVTTAKESSSLVDTAPTL